MKAYTALLNIISKLFEIVTGLLLAVIVIIVFCTVISSKFFGVTPAWANELPLILIVWFGLMGAGIGVRDKAHLAVEFIVRGLPEAWKVFFFRLSYTLMLAFATVMTVAGMRLVIFTFVNQETFPATKLPVGLCYLAIPLGGAFIFMHSLKHLLDLFSGTYDFTSIDEEAIAEMDGGGN
jgi:TRAP-type C4-dicarboxylate transport system permease small subunit